MVSRFRDRVRRYCVKPVRRLIRRIAFFSERGTKRRMAWIVRRRLREETPYEPIQLGQKVSAAVREWEPRWLLIRTEIERYGASNLVDVGCAEGWFVRRSAEDLGCFAVGVEMDNERLWPNELSRLHDDVERCATIKARMSPASLEQLPRFDMALCLSVVHHVIREGGLDAGRAFIKSLASRVDKAIVFEMGTSEENRMKWVDKMPPMPDGQAAFLKTYLESAGLVNVRQLGASRSFRREAERILMVGEPVYDRDGQPSRVTTGKHGSLEKRASGDTIEASKAAAPE